MQFILILSLLHVSHHSLKRQGAAETYPWDILKFSQQLHVWNCTFSLVK